jgi:putative restriction endonuclease
MSFWWVNQNQTGKYEIAGGFMWSPKRNRNGSFNRFYENMRLVDAGDLLFSYVDQLIQYIGVVQSPAVSGPRPAEFADTIWDNDGWLVPVEWHRPREIVRPRGIIDILRPLLPRRYSPLQSETGNGLQSVYLAAVPEPMANELLRPLGSWRPGASPILPELATSETAIDRLEDQIEAQIKNNTSIDVSDKRSSSLAAVRGGFARI